MCTEIQLRRVEQGAEYNLVTAPVPYMAGLLSQFQPIPSADFTRLQTYIHPPQLASKLLVEMIREEGRDQTGMFPRIIGRCHDKDTALGIMRSVGIGLQRRLHDMGPQTEAAYYDLVDPQRKIVTVEGLRAGDVLVKEAVDMLTAAQTPEAIAFRQDSERSLIQMVSAVNRTPIDTMLHDHLYKPDHEFQYPVYYEPVDPQGNVVDAIVKMKVPHMNTASRAALRRILPDQFTQGNPLAENNKDPHNVDQFLRDLLKLGDPFIRIMIEALTANKETQQSKELFRLLRRHQHSSSMGPTHPSQHAIDTTQVF